ncbi:MAG: GldG family protein, partial [Spirochaetaceae bacterium]|nr:GldG family protein [Spirochaetaceae bacterium]
MDARIGKKRGIVLLVLTVAVIAAAVLVAERFDWRLDLTADKAYSLSPVSRKLAAELPEPLRLTYYRSPGLAERHPGPRAVEDFLREFEAAGRGRVTLEVLDPATSPAGSGGVEALGILPQRMQVVERNEQRVAVVDSGLVLEYLARLETMPFVLGVENLEYDLVKAARRVIS